MWTRNYKNLIMTTIAHASAGSSSSYSTSGFSFGEGNYFSNYKTQGGVVYELYTDINGTSNGYKTSVPTFCRNNSGAMTAYCSLQTTTSDSPTTLDADRIYIQLGSSNTPATEMDYKLGSLITAVSASKASATAVRNDDGTNTITYNLIVQATADITVAEVGLFRPFYRCSATSSGDKYGNYVLLNRIVLDAPVSIASGQTASIQFSVTTPKITFA